MPVRLGGCACSAVRFEARGKPYRVGLCHCLTCRKVHGAPFNAFAIYPIEAVTITGRTATYKPTATGRRAFCRACGGHVFSRDEGSDEIELYLGCFDEPSTLTPTYEAFVPRREAWLGDLSAVHARFEGNRPKGGRAT